MYRRTRVTIIAAACVAALGAMLLIPNGKEIAVADTASIGTSSQETIATIDAMLGNSDPLSAAARGVAAPAQPATDPEPDNFQTAALVAPVETTPPIDPTLRADAIGPAAVNLRTGPSSASATVGVLQPGQALHAGASQDGWVEVTLDDGTTGWVYSRYLASVAATAPTQVAEADEPSSVKAVPDSNADLEGKSARIEASIAVRAKPSGNSEAMFRTEPGERVRILDVRGNWLRIRTADGSSGWIERAG